MFHRRSDDILCKVWWLEIVRRLRGTSYGSGGEQSSFRVWVTIDDTVLVAVPLSQALQEPCYLLFTGNSTDWKLGGISNDLSARNSSEASHSLFVGTRVPGYTHKSLVDSDH